jgi:phage shock protein PspC (stress-responsive transcriptional regulator)
MKKAYLDEKNKKFLGVIAGIAHYFDIDATILRVLWILIVVFTGFLPGLIAYIVMYLVMPEGPNQHAIPTPTEEK